MGQRRDDDILPGTPEPLGATVKDDGTFRANFEVKPGTYRAKIVPPSGSGLLTGKSPTLTVS